MKVLITGAAGFIGSQLAHRLWADGLDLLLVDNFSYGKRDNLIFRDHDFTAEVLRVDIRDKAAIAQLLKDGDVDFIYNLAGIAPLPDCQSNPTEAIDVNVTGFVNLLENARLYGVKKIIQASTNAIYENETVFPTTEKQTQWPTLVYPNTKFCAERFAESFCRTYGMNVTCIRFANVYGPHIDCLRKQPPFVAYMIRELYLNRTPTFHSDGNQKRDYIYVDDLIDLAIAVQRGEGFDAVNCSSMKSYSVNDMYRIASALMGKHIPAAFADNAHYWERYPELFEGHYVIRDSILAAEINKLTLCDHTYAFRRYGWSPKVDMEEGLGRVIEQISRLLSRQEDEAT